METIECDKKLTLYQKLKPYANLNKFFSANVSDNRHRSYSLYRSLFVKFNARYRHIRKAKCIEMMCERIFRTSFHSLRAGPLYCIFFIFSRVLVCIKYILFCAFAFERILYNSCLYLNECLYTPHCNLLLFSCVYYYYCLTRELT